MNHATKQLIIKEEKEIRVVYFELNARLRYLGRWLAKCGQQAIDNPVGRIKTHVTVLAVREERCAA